VESEGEGDGGGERKRTFDTMGLDRRRANAARGMAMRRLRTPWHVLITGSHWRSTNYAFVETRQGRYIECMQEVSTDGSQPIALSQTSHLLHAMR